MAEARTQDAISSFAFTTTVSNLAVSTQPSAATVTCTTANAARGQLQVGPSSGTYTTFKSGLESVPTTSHLLVAYGLTPSTTYHYILQWYDGFGTVLDATTDTTFTTLAAPVGGAAPGAIIGPLIGGNGVPAASLGTDGSYYFRYDGTTGAFIYHRAAGAWTAVI